MSEVSQVKTALPIDQALAYIADAYRVRTGRVPSDKTLAILGAQYALETGAGNSMYNWNFGNITTPTKSWRHGWYVNKYEENPHIYRSYPGPADGAKDFINFLHQSYWLAFDQAQQGNLKQYVMLLKRHPWSRDSFSKGFKAYFESSLESYIKGLRRHYDELLARLEGENRSPLPAPSSDSQPLVGSVCSAGGCSMLRSVEPGRLDPLSQGSSGADVCYLQVLVGAKPDGKYGPATAGKVRAFQSGAGITVDGVCGSQTWTALKMGLDAKAEA